MKKHFLILTFTLLFIGNINAQEVQYGIKFGLNISQTSRDKQSQRYAMHYGLMAELREKGSLFAFQPEILFSGQGYATRFNEQKDIHIFDYIAVPIMVKYYLTDDLNLQIGPRLAVNINTQRQIKNKTNSFKQEIEGLRKFDAGVSTGIGYKHSSGVNFSIRYYLGAREIYKIPLYQSVTRNSLLEISAGYFF